jgi:glycosyltransferase involved in cell wall biosynthesis
MNSNSIKICMLSCTHAVEDDRIYWKESLSLCKKGYSLTHIAVGDKEANYTSPEGISCIQIKRTSGSFFHRYRFYNKIFEAAAAQKANVYHLHDWQLNIIGKKLKQLSWKPNVVYDAHESIQLLLQQDISDKTTNIVSAAIKNLIARRADKWEKKKTAGYDAVITAEEYVLSTFMQLPEQQQLVLHNYSCFSNEHPSSPNEKKYDVIYAGLLAKNRGIAELIEATKLLKEKGFLIKILLIGSFCDEGYKKEVTDKISSLNLKENIELHPAVAYQEIKNYYKQSRIGICAWHLTEKNKQAIPIKIFEYMAFGLPVIFSENCFASKYISETGCGILINPGKPEQIATAISAILNDDKIYKQFSENGMKAVDEKYNWEKESEQLINFYSLLIK